MPTPQMSMSESATDAQIAGNLYLQTNELSNHLIHYHRATDGTIAEVERIPTGGAGSGVFKPISGQASAPNAFEGAASVILSPDRRFLFATNGGDNSVSSFGVSADGKLSLIDVKRTGNLVTGPSGTAKSLAYAPASNTLYVLHSFGPDHLRLMSVDGDGRLTPRSEKHTVNTPGKDERVPTMAVLTPDGQYLIVGTTFDQLPHANPDGSPILWVTGDDGRPRSIASNAPDPDGLAVFGVGEDGALGEASFQDAGCGSPFYPAFLHDRPDHFVIGAAVGDGIVLASIGANGKITTGPLVQIDTSAGRPSELCWLSVSPDDRFVYATNFGYSSLSSFRIDGNVVSVAQDQASPRVAGDGTFRALNGTVSSGPSDNWLCPEGTFLYQLFGNASKLVGYAVQADASLVPITEAEIPYNSPQGLAGF
ncbi:6-phosphogluconolactonase (cycloisomerase 2 family) [Kribbella rubisoli]|uniref:6-phosphogluconolactonase (Cycloisomerase 2 family) n=1 Tax=Kribbella rubisoli TaxID=3075929 RepID=A0A4Q7VYU0_9ACTN|nr:beta-propeller fold lactonase family protein [Kribbella rubisoli]RZU01873.1 6-phosphogluconolactonase (cycloisomerase 2 family) [Kribbella rubisoli]